eukprot:jgi/Botrbrau1/1591/Bobra.0185s0012.2
MSVPDSKFAYTKDCFEDIYDILREFYPTQQDCCWSLDKLNKLGELIHSHGKEISCLPTSTLLTVVESFLEGLLFVFTRLTPFPGLSSVFDMASSCLVLFRSLPACTKQILAFWHDLACYLIQPDVDDLMTFITWLDGLSCFLTTFLLEIQRAGQEIGKDLFCEVPAEASVCLLFFVQHGQMDAQLDHIVASLKATILQSADVAHDHLIEELTIMQIFRVSMKIIQSTPITLKVQNSSSCTKSTFGRSIFKWLCQWRTPETCDMFDGCILAALLAAIGVNDAGGLNAMPGNRLQARLQERLSNDTDIHRQNPILLVFLQQETVSMFSKALLQIFANDRTGPDLVLAAMTHMNVKHPANFARACTDLLLPESNSNMPTRLSVFRGEGRVRL